MTIPNENDVKRIRRTLMAALPGYKFQIFMLDTRLKVFILSGPMPVPVPEIGLVDDERGFRADLSKHPEVRELFDLIRGIVFALKPRKISRIRTEYLLELGLGGKGDRPYWQRTPSV